SAVRRDRRAWADDIVDSRRQRRVSAAAGRGLLTESGGRPGHGGRMTTTKTTLAERARAKGWPDGLIERAIAINAPGYQLENWLSADPSPTFLFNVQKTIELWERL